MLIVMEKAEIYAEMLICAQRVRYLAAATTDLLLKKSYLNLAHQWEELAQYALDEKSLGAH